VASWHAFVTGLVAFVGAVGSMALSPPASPRASRATVAGADRRIAGARAAVGSARLRIPGSADQLIVVSSPTDDPPAAGRLATLRAYVRAGAGSPWRLVLGPWQAETGSGHLVPAARRREGDHATPIGVFGFARTMYGTRPNPGGLHYAYHRLVCGDWWDEDPSSTQYNRFVHVPCGHSPPFAGGSEALWTEGNAYPYMAASRFNTDPTIAGAAAPGSGIFLHSWLGVATDGCVALREPQLLAVLRWLESSADLVIEIGTVGELARGAG
jgi:L,D-peptidoglycan transpeptidase YkuD (ErfK/YbiS/YcfS/YnhG family)